MRRRLITLTTVAFLALTASALAASGFSTEQVWSTAADDWEPTVAIDPGSSYAYQATTRYSDVAACGKGLKHCILVRASSDSGKTWGGAVRMPADANVTAQNDPELKVASNGTLYAAWMNDWDVMFAKSTNHGASWSAPVDFRLQTGLKFTDKPMLAISPSGADVYVAFNSSDSYIASSHNGGASFTISAKTNADTNYWFAEEGAVAPNGTVFFAESAELQSGLGPVGLEIVRSKDGGATWQTTTLATSQERPACTTAGCPVDFYGPQTAVAVDTAGTVKAVYSANTANDAPLALYARTSTDNGATWSAATVVTSAGAAVGANFPQLAAGPTAGDFRLAWLDDRNGPAAWNAWFAKTSGTTWTTPTRLSNATSGAAYKTSAGFASPYGDYLGLAVTSAGVSFVTWGEGTSYTGPGGVWLAKG